MADVRWVKLATATFDDEKIRLIDSMPEADAILIIWVKLIAMAGKCNDGGAIYLREGVPYTLEMLATLLHRPVGTVSMALAVLEEFGMACINDAGYLCLPAWDKHQNVAGLEKIREQGRERQRRYRDKKKNGDFTVTLPNGEDEEKKVQKKKKSPMPGSFGVFWEQYPKKKAKGEAEKIWKRLAPDEELVGQIMEGLERAKRSRDWLKDGGQFIPFPTTWLNQKRWLDEDDTRVPPTPGVPTGGRMP